VSTTVFQPIISASVWPKTHYLDRAAMESASLRIYVKKFMLQHKMFYKNVGYRLYRYKRHNSVLHFIGA